MIHCERCEANTNPDRLSGWYQHASGWIRHRPKGANELALRKDDYRFLCPDCMALAKAGLTNQSALFDPAPDPEQSREPSLTDPVPTNRGETSTPTQPADPERQQGEVVGPAPEVSP